MALFKLLLRFFLLPLLGMFLGYLCGFGCRFFCNWRFFMEISSTTRTRVLWVITFAGPQCVCLIGCDLTGPNYV